MNIEQTKTICLFIYEFIIIIVIITILSNSIIKLTIHNIYYSFVILLTYLKSLCFFFKNSFLYFLMLLLVTFKIPYCLPFVIIWLEISKKYETKHLDML